ncbi:hypothetical protein MKX03_004733 [Papaver bracteatum]|nr:hypothetical protein MKX03_004733 [Papaver bracteatum]
MSDAVVPVVVDTPVDGKIVDSVEPAPVCDVPLESISPNQPPAIAVTAASAVRGVELVNSITGIDQLLANVHESHEALRGGSKKKLSRVKMEAVILRSVALSLMKHNDCVGARKRLLEARTSDPGLEYIDELKQVCDIVCIAKSQGNLLDWGWVWGINRTDNESEIEFNCTELIRTLEPIKNKFPEIQSALWLIKKVYSEFESKRAASLGACGSVKPLDIAHSEIVNIKGGFTSQSSYGTKRTVTEESEKSRLICNSEEHPLKRVRSLGGFMVNVSECGNSASYSDDAVNKLVDKENVAEDIYTDSDYVRLVGNERISDTAINKTGVSENPMKAMVHMEPSLELYDFSKDGKAEVFAVGQFLAVYDQEKMPRLYAQIIGIESCYKKETDCAEQVLYVRWLRPAPTNPDENKWHEAGLPVSCGFFKIDSVGKCNIGVISHLVSSFQEYHYSDKLFELYPQEGEVWAFYQEWNPFDWCSDPKTRKGCKFLLVEILSDYSDAAGVKVASLVKVVGYNTIFRRSGLSYQIAASKLLGFSHNIPVRSAGDMKGLFSGTVLDLDPLSIPEDVSVDTVAAELSDTNRCTGCAAYPGLEYINEMIKVCDIACAAESRGSGIDWCSVLEIDKTDDESYIELNYTELIGTLESIKKKFPDIQSALGLAEKAYRLYLSNLYLRWLRPAPINPDEKKWHEAGLPVSCGFFKLDNDNKINKCDAIVFSHLVSSFREYHYSKELFELYPREGEVWALYKEWKPFEWCSDPKRRKECKFLLVEILTDCSPATGVKVALLVKVVQSPLHGLAKSKMKSHPNSTAAPPAFCSTVATLIMTANST